MGGWSYEQARQAWQLKQEGYDIEQICLALGVRPSTVPKLVSRWEARLAQDSGWHQGLSVDVVNRLKRNGIDSLESLQMAWKEGRFQHGLVPNIGAVSIREIHAWLESDNVPMPCRETATPVIVYLLPEAVEALDEMADSTQENRSGVINRLILTADEERKY